MMEAKYDHLKVENDKYKTWLENKYFESGDLSKKPFAIVIPPPNVTGKLHLGHAWNTSIQDIIIRYKKLQGFDALWVPGMDHAGIATQAKIDEKLRNEGVNPREMSKEDWLEVAWKWKSDFADNIRRQWAKLGLALDYTKERFTLDEGLSKAVRYVFVKLYEEGLIYQGERIINWDPAAMTALSNEEVEYKEIKSNFYHIKYIIESSNEYLDVATTRPETLFGDTAVAVNPSDERYKHLIGKNVILPIVNKLIPIIGDEHADPEMGTGVVKITPAHDPNDFEVGERHNLEKIICINPDATMNEVAGIYNKQSREECRENVVNDLDKLGLLLSVEPIVHSVGHSQRSGVMIEPYLSKQWFVKMRPLADQVLYFQKDKDAKVNFVPKRFEKTMLHWMEISHDWCISRQLWWGHQIPAWYKDNEVYVGIEAPKGEGWVQDQDVLDTWFSSALWPFSTLGWPDDTDLLKRYYPNDVLVTGYDIIFFWVCRMVFQGEKFLKQKPFNEVLIHGLIRDAKGRKMSKSLGNGVDPMDVIDKYGADALRYFLVTGTAPGTDLRYEEEKVAACWNYINKIWNASRFVLTNIAGFDKEINYNNLKKEDKFILAKLNNVIRNVTKYMDKYEFHNVGSELYSFVWNDLCDSYIEMAKFTINTDETKWTLKYVLQSILKMLHPMMPFVTDEIYGMFNEENIIKSTYPVVKKELSDTKALNEVTEILEFVKKYRMITKENDIPKTHQVIVNNNNDYGLIISLLKLKNNIINEKINISTFNVDTINYSMTIYFEKTINIELQNKEIERLKQSINKRTNLLNSSFKDKAPANLVADEEKKLAEEKDLLNKLRGL